LLQKHREHLLQRRDCRTGVLWRPWIPAGLKTTRIRAVDSDLHYE